MDIAALRRGLFAWYSREGRDLPWKAERDPYRVWIREVMLQQTTVAAVIPYYERFLQRFPNVAALAAANLQDVLGLWEGLGYYSRGRNLHRAACTVVNEHNGRFPESAASLQQLSGIGRYTAGAIASFAFDQREPILEANTLRLYCRLLGFDGDPRSAAGQQRLWSFAESLLPRSNVSTFNQALMDLGATVCTPVNPQCEACPLRARCRAFLSQRQHEIPRPKNPPQVTIVHEAAFAIFEDGRWLLRQRQAGERWEGLWDFPRFDLEGPPAVTSTSRPGDSEIERLLIQLARETGIEAAGVGALPQASYTVTRFRIHAARIIGRRLGGTWIHPAPMQWVAAEEFGSLPLTRSSRQLADDLVDPRFAGERGGPLELRATTPLRKRRSLAKRSIPTQEFPSSPSDAG
jgi:A/G-specific adenine glycosylase